MAKMVHLNGTLVAAEQAAVSIYDAGFLHGFSTFTTMLARSGVVFRLKRHLSRLLGTAKLLGMKHEASAESLKRAVAELLEAEGLATARVRITLTPGGIVEPQRPTVLVTAEAVNNPSWWYEKGLMVIVSSFRQGFGEPSFGFKTGCYLPRILARREAAEKGAEEALWYTLDGQLSEACFCNVFLVQDGRVLTPPEHTPVLPGIVREAVLELCGSLDIACDDKTTLTVRDMLAAREIFLTGSTSGVRPVVQVERHAVGDGTPGPITRKLMDAYGKLLEKECAAGNGGK